MYNFAALEDTFFGVPLFNTVVAFFDQLLASPEQIVVGN